MNEEIKENDRSNYQYDDSLKKIKSIVIEHKNIEFELSGINVS